MLVSNFRLVIFAVLSLGVACEVSRSNDLQPEAENHFETRVRPVLMEFCGDCHEANDSEGSILFLNAMTVAELTQDRTHWKSVAEQLRNRTMPPGDEAQPTEQQRIDIADWIDQTLRATACDEGEYAGAVTTRRLNRNEYDRTMADLLGIDASLAQKFPVDGSGGEGFDNNGETLFLPPVLLERYLEAATEAVQEVVKSEPQVIQYNLKQLQSAPDGDVTQYEFTPVIFQTGDFDLNLQASKTDSDVILEILLDDLPLTTLTLTSEKLSHRLNVRMSRGIHRLEIRYPTATKCSLTELQLKEQQADVTDSERERHRRIVGLKIGEKPERPTMVARKSIQSLADRAFRRTASAAEVEQYLSLFQRAFDRGDPFDHALKQALRAVLVSPHFLFRLEAPTDSEQPIPLTDDELATRLSYFLWSSMPDEKLRQIATAGKLNSVQVLKQQVDRLLSDRRAETFCYEFAGQWLGTIEIGASVVPDTGKFKGQFSTELLYDLRYEPVVLFQHLIQTDGSVIDLLAADYAIVTNRLKKHYEMAGTKRPPNKGRNPWSANPKKSELSEFQMLQLDDARRGGVLGMGAVHLLTSYPNRTSPVLRGGWVLETLLGVRVPSPPPDIPQLPRKKNNKTLSAKQALARHRKNPTCAACHNLMDPLGFSLENFDVLGRWREEDQDAKSPIDSTATLPTGQTISGLPGLRDALMERKDEVVRHMAEKMMGYALGRSLVEQDDCVVQRVTDKVIADDYRIRTMIREVVLSTPFRNKQKADDDQ